eukprot:gene6908-14023_t
MGIFLATHLGSPVRTGQEGMEQRQTNVLYIMFDDLRPELNIYGKDYMITPNFNRLAAKSVMFDHAYCQVSVCNPSRTSILTGLRPDTTRSYAFEKDFGKYMVFPKHLRSLGYKTHAIGKLAHWDTQDDSLWVNHFNGNWYDYQNNESYAMKSSVMPDKITPEESFRDHMFTSMAIEKLREFTNGSNTDFFLLGLGLKLPHLALHVPQKYFDMYKNMDKNVWKLTDRERRFPRGVDSPSFRCCSEQSFSYMNEEGALPATQSMYLGDSVNYTVPDDMHHELMLGYASAVTFMDVQLGRILDVIDELSLWDNLTIVLTSDHGMHNGEKGMWEKWSLFDESTRVPLFIHHPLSPFQGKRFVEPVELLDIYPTLLDILGLSKNRTAICEDHKCLPLQGKSLAPVILGDSWGQRLLDESDKRNGNNKKRTARRRNSRKPKPTSQRRLADANFNIIPLGGNESYSMPMVDKFFAISQLWRCANKTLLDAPDRDWDKSLWTSCSLFDNYNEKGMEELSIMGYSMRTTEFRYTAWMPFNRTSMGIRWDVPIYDEELYDHRGEALSDFTHLEVVDLAKNYRYRKVLQSHRKSLLIFIRRHVVFYGPIEF